jgi:hypothetical protein
MAAEGRSVRRNVVAGRVEELAAPGGGAVARGDGRAAGHDRVVGGSRLEAERAAIEARRVPWIVVVEGKGAADGGLWANDTHTACRENRISVR